MKDLKVQNLTVIEIATTTINFIKENELSNKKYDNIANNEKIQNILFDLKKEALENCSTLKERADIIELCRNIGIYIESMYRYQKKKKKRTVELIKDSLNYL